jgi:hypothetical protein
MDSGDGSFAARASDRRVHVVKHAFEVIERSGESFFRRQKQTHCWRSDSHRVAELDV